MILIFLIFHLICALVLALADRYNDADVSLFEQQKLRVTGAGLSVVVEFWYDEAIINEASPCLLLNDVLTVLTSWNCPRIVVKYWSSSVKRNGVCKLRGHPSSSVDIVVLLATEFGGIPKSPDVYVRMGLRTLPTTIGVPSDNIEAKAYHAVLLMGYETSREIDLDRVDQVLVLNRADRKGNAVRLNLNKTSLLPPAIAIIPDGGNGDRASIVSHINETFISGVLDSDFHHFAYNNLQRLRAKLLPRRQYTSQSKKAVAVIVEPRILPAFEFCVRNVLHHLMTSSIGSMNWKLHVHHSTGFSGNEDFVKTALGDIYPSIIKFIPLPDSFGNVGGRGYNQFLKSSLFWKPLNIHGFESAFIFQADSLIVHTTRVKDYLKYDFVGAPWPAENGPTCCNGGFSLRRVSSMRNITSKKRSLNPDLNEDVFFTSVYAEEFALKLPSAIEAAHFSLEAPTGEVDSHFYPMALHAAWAYNDRSLVQRLLLESCKPLNLQCEL